MVLATKRQLASDLHLQALHILEGPQGCIGVAEVIPGRMGPSAPPFEHFSLRGGPPEPGRAFQRGCPCPWRPRASPAAPGRSENRLSHRQDILLRGEAVARRLGGHPRPGTRSC